MKRIIFLLAIIGLMSSCKKDKSEDPQPLEENPTIILSNGKTYKKVCNCSTYDIMANRFPADSCGTIRITNLHEILPGDMSGGGFLRKSN